MSELIDRQAAIDAVLDRMNVEKYGRNAKPEEIQWALEELPPAQPERKTGRWIDEAYDPFPGIPENGGCRILDFMELKEQLLEKFKQFLETFEQEAKEAQDDRYTPDNICGIPRKKKKKNGKNTP